MTTDSKNTRFSPQLGLFLLLAALAVGIRLHKLSTPPLEFQPARQYSGLITATTLRWMMFERSERPTLARHVATQQIGLEPPLQQALTAAVWQLLDREDLRVPRILSMLAWFLASWPLALLLRQWFGTEGMLAGLIFWWFWPYGIAVSRAFMPEALALLTLFWAQLKLRDREHNSTIGLIVVLLIAALVKPDFALVPLVIWIALLPELRRTRVWLIGLLIAVSGLYAILRLSNWSGFRFFPELVFAGSTWKGYLLMLDHVYGAGILLAACAGVLMAPATVRPWLAGAILGWLIVIVLNNDLARHLDHYHLILVPAILIGLASLAHTLKTHLSPLKFGFLIILLACAGVREGRLLIRGLDPAIVDSMHPDIVSAAIPVSRAERMAARMGPDRRVLCLSPAYGQILAFHGDCIVHPWLKASDRRHLNLRNNPNGELSAAALLDQELRANPVRWFAITDYKAYKADPKLHQLLRVKARHVDAGNADGILFELIDR